MTHYEGESMFLHGQISLHIFAAKNLPDMDSWVAKLYDKNDVTDPFVDVFLDDTRLIKTTIIYNDLNPEWNELYRIQVRVYLFVCLDTFHSEGKWISQH